MRMTCPVCGNSKKFLVPLWVRCTFKINPDGTLSILHVRPKESLADKLVSQGKSSFAITCQECGADAEVELNEYETLEEEAAQRKALEEL